MSYMSCEGSCRAVIVFLLVFGFFGSYASRVRSQTQEHLHVVDDLNHLELGLYNSTSVSSTFPVQPFVDWLCQICPDADKAKLSASFGRFPVAMAKYTPGDVETFATQFANVFLHETSLPEKERQYYDVAIAEGLAENMEKIKALIERNGVKAAIKTYTDFFGTIQEKVKPLLKHLDERASAEQEVAVYFELAAALFEARSYLRASDKNPDFPDFDVLIGEVKSFQVSLRKASVESARAEDVNLEGAMNAAAVITDAKDLETKFLIKEDCENAVMRKKLTLASLTRLDIGRLKRISLSCVYYEHDRIKHKLTSLQCLRTGSPAYVHAYRSVLIESIAQAVSRQSKMEEVIDAEVVASQQPRNTASPGAGKKKKKQNAASPRKRKGAKLSKKGKGGQAKGGQAKGGERGKAKEALEKQKDSLLAKLNHGQLDKLAIHFGATKDELTKVRRVKIFRRLSYCALISRIINGCLVTLVPDALKIVKEFVEATTSPFLEELFLSNL